MYRFYELYNQEIVNFPQGVENFASSNLLQGAENFASSILLQGAENFASTNLLQGVENFASSILLQGADDFKTANFPHHAEKLFVEICSIPWDHQRRIIDKSKGDPDKALFFVRKVIENGWGRDVLLNFLGTDLYERQAKAITNFSKTLPALQSDLAQQTTKDPLK